MTLAMLLAAGWLIAWAAPETPIGSALHRWLIVKPADLLSRITRGQVIIALGLACVLAGAAWLGHDALSFMAMSSPELLAAFAIVEVSVWVEAVAAVVVSWSAMRGTRLVRRVRAGRPAGRARRLRRPARPPANDDDRPSWRVAA